MRALLLVGFTVSAAAAAATAAATTDGDAFGSIIRLLPGRRHRLLGHYAGPTDHRHHCGYVRRISCSTAGATALTCLLR